MDAAPIVSLQPLSRRIAVLGYDEVNDAFVRLFPCERTTDGRRRAQTDGRRPPALFPSSPIIFVPVLPVTADDGQGLYSAK